MSNLEPSYLRYVYDKLNSGALNPGNAAALPHGFIGLYEQEFMDDMRVKGRESILNQLTLWALLKGPVSAGFVSNVLGLTEEEGKGLIDRYSSWFNSPDSGKYQLYHERLRVYLLQKLNEHEIQTLNERLIDYLERAIELAKGDEGELYALEYLHQHMAIESKLGNHYNRLHDYVNRGSLWSRQIQLSKGYQWSQDAIQQGIKEGARRNLEMNTVRSTVNSVKLMIQEQNSAEDIINLLNEGDYQTALKRAESWEGERQFKLYLLFLHELTIGSSKGADFGKEACKAILEAIDQTPEDHSVLDWTKFYPELAIYKYHEVLTAWDLDATIIWKRGDNNLVFGLIKSEDVTLDNYLIGLAEDIAVKLEYYDLQALRESEEKSEGTILLSKLLTLKTDKQSAFRFVSELTNAFWKSQAFMIISKLYIGQGDKEGSDFALLEAGRHASEIPKVKAKIEAYFDLSKVLMDLGCKKESKSVLTEAMLLKFELKDDDLIRFYVENSKINLYQGDNKGLSSSINEIRLIISNTLEYYEKFWSQQQLVKVLLLTGDIKEAATALEQALHFALQIQDKRQRSRAFSDLSKLYIEIGNQKDAYRIALEIYHEFDKFQTFANLSKIMLENGDKEGANYTLNKSLELASEIPMELKRSQAYSELAMIYMNLGDITQYLQLASKISREAVKSKTYAQIFNFLIDSNSLTGASYAILESLHTNPEISDKNRRDKVYERLSKELIYKGNHDLALKVASEIFNGYSRESAYLEISNSIMHKGKFDIAENVVLEIQSNYMKSRAFIEMSKFHLENGDKERAVLQLNRSIEKAFDVSDFEFKSILLLSISQVLVELGNKEESLRFVSEITGDLNKIVGNADLSKILMEQGCQLGSKSIIDESLRVASEIQNDRNKSEAYLNLHKILMEKGDSETAKSVLKESLHVATEIQDPIEKLRAYSNTSKILMEQGDQLGSKSIIDESLRVASEIQDIEVKSKAYLNLHKTLMEKGDSETAKSILKESLRIISDFQEKHTIDASSIYAVLEGPEFFYFLPTISINLMELGEKEESLRVASEIEDDYWKSVAYSNISKILMEQGEKEEFLRIVSMIPRGSERVELFKDFGMKMNFSELLGLLPKLDTESNQKSLIYGYASSIAESMDLQIDNNPFLYRFCEHTQCLSDILFYKAKMACFFEKESNVEKLDMLSEVLDIKDWRRVSTC